MLIEKHGKVTITEKEIIISDFVFNLKDGIYYFADCSKAASNWAKERLLEAEMGVYQITTA